MNVDIQPFDFDGMQVRAVLVDGEPWWIAADIAKVLDIGRTHDAVRGLDEDETRTDSIRTSAGPRQVTLVSESGLYSMVLRSRKPDASRFRRWVTHEVLPAIRRTGRFEAAPAAAVVPQTLQAALRAYADQLDATAAAEARALVLTERVEVLVPMAEQAEHHRAADGLVSVGDFANSLKAWALREHRVRVLHGEVWDFLAEIGLLIRGNTVRHNQPTASAIERDFVRVKVGERQSKSSSSGTKATATPRLTPAGEGWAWDRAVTRIAAHGSLRKPAAAAAIARAGQE